ncbi:hypothetical protein RRG08_018896 [Elysia crispata]|uniref:Secreted protein n=1 Tax=Elysia crispata TaxID=231223 RepID=A0AAE1A832_9GAST|nr:hypothetical protein RRG08_018896 [Elysia crispata]
MRPTHARASSLQQGTAAAILLCVLIHLTSGFSIPRNSAAIPHSARVKRGVNVFIYTKHCITAYDASDGLTLIAFLSKFVHGFVCQKSLSGMRTVCPVLRISYRGNIYE